MNDNKLHAMVRKSLDKDVETVSASIQSKLTRARMEALDKASNNINDNFGVFSLLLNRPIQIAAVVASLSFIAVSSFSVMDISKQETVEIAQEILTSGEPLASNAVNETVGKDFFLTEEDLDFFENLELYQWLDSEFKTS